MSGPGGDGSAEALVAKAARGIASWGVCLGHKCEDGQSTLRRTAVCTPPCPHALSFAPKTALSGRVFAALRAIKRVVEKIKTCGKCVTHEDITNSSGGLAILAAVGRCTWTEVQVLWSYAHWSATARPFYLLVVRLVVRHPSPPDLGPPFDFGRPFAVPIPRCPRSVSLPKNERELRDPGREIPPGVLSIYASV